GPATLPLFDTAKALQIGFYLGYAELEHRNGAAHHYNTSILVDKNGAIVGKYRKVHLPGHADNRPSYPFQHLEKRYFEPGDRGLLVWRAFSGNVGMCICNDRSEALIAVGGCKGHDLPGRPAMRKVANC